MSMDARLLTSNGLPEAVPSAGAVRVGVHVALGSLHVVPKEPGLVHGLRPGEAVERVADPVSRIGQALLAAGTALAPQPLAMRTLSDVHPGTLTNSANFELDRGAA